MMDSTTPFQPWTANDEVKNVKNERELVGDAKLHQENVNHSKHTQTASHDQETVVPSKPVPGSSSTSDPDASSPGTSDTRMDSHKITSLQNTVEKTLSPESRQRVTQLLEAVEALSGPERLLLYLRLPTGTPPHDPLKQPINPLGSRAELQQTVTWIQTHLEVDPDVSLPKQDVYDEYVAFCMSSNMKPLSTADFGKVMKQVYPSVRPRRLGTRGNSRYCYAGLRKKIKLEVPQLPDLSDASKLVQESEGKDPGVEKIVCEWAEIKLGMKFSSLSELSRHLLAVGSGAVPTASSSTPPPLAALPQPLGGDESSRQLMKQLKRKIQTQSTPGRPKKNKALEVPGESPPSTSYAPPIPVKHESEHIPESSYVYPPSYMYDVRPPYPPYNAPPRAHPAPHPASHSTPHPASHSTPHPAQHAMPPIAAMHTAVHDYRQDPYIFDPPYVAPRDLTVPSEATHNLPINLSSDASLDLSTERTDWQRRRPPEPPPGRLPLPGKKLILETYQSETQAGSPRAAQMDARSSTVVVEEFPRSEYLPKKMRAAEILGGKLAAARQTLLTDAPSTSTTPSETSARPEAAFLEDPKNVASRSKSTAAALVREEQEAASPAQSVKAHTPKTEIRKKKNGKNRRSGTPDACCGLDGINLRTGIICDEKHSEILNRERVISICNMDKHALDDYLNEGSSQEHEEELLQYFHRDEDHDSDPPIEQKATDVPFLEAGLDPQDDHSQGKNEKLSQLRELLAKNLKNQGGASAQIQILSQESQLSSEQPHEQSLKPIISEGAFKPVYGSENVNGQISSETENNMNKHCVIQNHKEGPAVPYGLPAEIENSTQHSGESIYNGNCQNIPQSPTTRTQQYDFVPISEGCHSPSNFNPKSPLGFGNRGQSPSKARKPVIMGGSLQTSPTSHSTAASPFVSPRNTPVPRSRLCPRPIPKHNGRKRRTLLSLGVSESCPKQFAIPSDQKIMTKSACGLAIKYYQPMSAPPSPNILSAQFKNQIPHCMPGISNGNANLNFNFFPNTPFRENMNGELTQPLSADPLSSEVSQFFQGPIVNYRAQHDAAYRSQSVPLKQGVGNIVNILSYNNTPVGSVPPTPVPHEFCDFGTLADTCDISKAGLNPETLDKIYDAIDSSNDVLNPNVAPNLLNANENFTNGCNTMPVQQLLADEQLTSLISPDSDLLHRNNHFNQTFSEDNGASDDVTEFLKRTNSVEFDLSDVVNDRSKYYMSRSVPSTPLPYKRTAHTLQLGSRRSRELFPTDNFVNVTNGISSKSVPSTPQLPDERNVFSYSNRDFLINGNSVGDEACSSGHGPGQGPLVESDETLGSPLQDILREDILEPLTPNADLLADLDKMDAAPYVDL